MVVLFEKEAALRARPPLVSFAQPMYCQPLTRAPIAGNEGGPEETGGAFIVGWVKFAGQVMSANVAASGPEVIVIQPGNLEIIPWTGSLMSGGCSGQLLGYWGLSTAASGGHALI